MSDMASAVVPCRDISLLVPAPADAIKGMIECP